MTDYKTCVTESGLVLLPLSELIELMEYKLRCLQEANSMDSSWNYGIDELEADIKYLKAKQ